MSFKGNVQCSLPVFQYVFDRGVDFLRLDELKHQWHLNSYVSQSFRKIFLLEFQIKVFESSKN